MEFKMVDVQFKAALRREHYSYHDEGFIIHRLTSAEQTFFSNAYIIETDSALVVVDTLMLNADAAMLRKQINDIGKPLIAIIITHAHPDHYNGSYIVSSGLENVSIISTQGVRDNIKETVAAKEEKWRPHFGEQWPASEQLLTKLPNMLVKDGEIVELDGLNYRFQVLGAAESNSDLCFTLGNNQSVVFVGDVVFNQMHGFMNDGNSEQWLQVLSKLLVEISDVKQLFTGHGDPGETVQLIQAQIDYVKSYRANLLATIDGDNPLNDTQKESFERAMKANFPDYQLVPFITAGIEGVQQELLNV